MGLRDTILAVNDPLPREKVEVPEWGCTVYVATMTGTERDAFEASRVEQRGKRNRTNLDNFRAALLVRVLQEEDGTRIFTNADVDIVGKKSGLVLDRLFDIARRLSGMSDEDVEELEKN